MDGFDLESHRASRSTIFHVTASVCVLLAIQQGCLINVTLRAIYIAIPSIKLKEYEFNPIIYPQLRITRAARAPRPSKFEKLKREV
jgi:hypothetical protein